MRNPVEQLSEKAKTLGDDVYEVCKVFLDSENFARWSGSSKPNQHHYGEGGLAQHTLEVVNTCFRVKSLYEHQYEIDSKELFLAAFFHDLGKMYDYRPCVVVHHFDYSRWESTDHKRLIHHISRSATIWSERSKLSHYIHDKYHDRVLHAILAHHGKREHGSPVAPKTRVAWILTLCEQFQKESASFQEKKIKLF